MKKLSIIIPCYNVEKYVFRCIESLRGQKCNEVEFIFVNDGSTDSTADYIKKISEQDSRVIFINKKNEGVSKARNDALDVCSGEYVFFLDGDDYLETGACQKLIEISTSDCVILKRHNLVYPSHIFLKVLPLSEGEYSSELFINSFRELPISPKLYKTSIIKENKLRFNEKVVFGEVFLFFTSYLKFAKTISVKDVLVYNYVMREESATHKLDSNRDMTILSTISEFSRSMENSLIEKSVSYKISVLKLILQFTVNKYAKTDYKYDKELRKLLYSVRDNDYVQRCMRGLKMVDTYTLFLKLFDVSPRISYILLKNLYKIRFKMKKKCR